MMVVENNAKKEALYSIRFYCKIVDYQRRLVALGYFSKEEGERTVLL